MKSVIFITGSFYPKSSANSNCIKNIIDVFDKDYELIVIHINNQSEVSKFIGNYKIESVVQSKNAKRESIIKIKKNESQYLKYFYIFLHLVIRFKGFFLAHFKINNVDNDLIKSYTKKLNQIQDVHAIIPACLPIEGLIAATDFKKLQKVKVIPVLFDKFSANNTLHRTSFNKSLKFKRHLAIEKDIIETSDAIIHVDSWSDHLNSYFSEYKDKFNLIEHPLLKEFKNNTPLVFNKYKTNFIYTGALYNKLRSPKGMFNSFEKVFSENKNVVLHLYTRGDCNSLIDKFSKLYPENVINYGSVNSDTANSAMSGANFLLSIGNTDITQLPSKIFEYISTGKPIIHFFTEDNDPIIPILKKYENSLLISTKKENPDVIADKINKFITRPMKTVSFEQTSKIYHDATPEYTKDILLKLL